MPKKTLKQVLPASLATRGTRARRRQALAAEDYFEKRDAGRKKHSVGILRKLNQDEEFVLETERIKRTLLNLRNGSPDVFRKFFRRFTPLVLLNQSHVEKVLRGIRNQAARSAFTEYVRYASRFKVRMSGPAGTFRPQPFDPPERKFRATIVDGHLRCTDEEQPREPLFEYLFLDEGMTVAPELEKLIEREDVKFLRLDDSTGGSLLNEIEHLAYEPSGLTFIVHHARQPRIYMLIGENLSTDTFLRSAAKAITALQKDLFNRKKAGRPANIPKLRKAIRISNRLAGPQEQAFAISKKPGTARDLETGGRYIRRIKATLKQARFK